MGSFPRAAPLPHTLGVTGLAHQSKEPIHHLSLHLKSRAVRAKAPSVDPGNCPVPESHKKSGAGNLLPVALRQQDTKPWLLSPSQSIFISHTVSYLFLSPAQDSPTKFFLAQPGPSLHPPLPDFSTTGSVTSFPLT